MSITFATFNILSTNNEYFNKKSCISKKNIPDTDFRYGVIANAILRSGYDIIFLQEVGTEFPFDLFKYVYNVIRRAELVILVHKYMGFGSFQSADMWTLEEKRAYSGSTFNKIMLCYVYSTKCNYYLALYNIHLPTNRYVKETILKKVFNHTRRIHDRVGGIIIAGDMNVNNNNNLFNNGIMTSLVIGKIGYTSYKHGFCLPVKPGCIKQCMSTCNEEGYVEGYSDIVKCVGCTSVCNPICKQRCSGYTIKENRMFYNFLDHVYVSNNMAGNIDVVYNLNGGKFDPTNSYYPVFDNMGPPYCDITKGTIEECAIVTYRNLYEKTGGHMWPSDHALLKAILVCPTRSIEYHKPKTTVRRPDYTVGGVGYKRLYKKYKRKYLNLEKNHK